MATPLFAEQPKRSTRDVVGRLLFGRPSIEQQKVDLSRETQRGQQQAAERKRVGENMDLLEKQLPFLLDDPEEFDRVLGEMNEGMSQLLGKDIKFAPGENRKEFNRDLQTATKFAEQNPNDTEGIQRMFDRLETKYGGREEFKERTAALPRAIARGEEAEELKADIAAVPEVTEQEELRIQAGASAENILTGRRGGEEGRVAVDAWGDDAGRQLQQMFGTLTTSGYVIDEARSKDFEEAILLLEKYRKQGKGPREAAVLAKRAVEARTPSPGGDDVAPTTAADYLRKNKFK